MTAGGIGQIVLLLAVLTALTPPLGAYVARVYEGRRVPLLGRALGPLERGLYRACGIDPAREQGWKAYGAAVLAFSAVGFALLYAILRLQGGLPLNPLDLPGVAWDVAFNAAASFVTNTNWQFYGGESTLSYASQMVGLTVQNFVSAAAGMAVLAAVIRGFVRRGGETLGNFWADLVRITLYVLIPLALIWAVVLGSQGVVQSLADPVTYRTVDARVAAAPDGTTPAEQTVVRGAVASQVAIKQLGTNGGGYYNANSAAPFENPNGLSNFMQLLAVLLIPAALTYTFGVMAGSRAQGWALFAAMMALVVASLAVAVPFEQRGSQALRDAGLELSADADQPGGNMSDKEVRFGVATSALWGVATTAASNGSVNGGLEAWTGGGAVPLFALMAIGEVAFGGVGSGLYGMLLYVLVAVFIAGLLVGRTPEYLGKKVESREVRLALVGLLAAPLGLLVTLGAAVATDAGRASMFGGGAQGFGEAFYAYASQWNNNGSAFAGYGGTELSTTLGGVAMLLGRFMPLLAVLAIAGSLATKRVSPPGAGTLRTTSPTFVALLIAVVVLLAALTFLPALGLGPLAVELSERPF